MSLELFERHRVMLELAMDALASDSGFDPFPGSASGYSEGVVAEGQILFRSYSDSFFYLDQPASSDRVGGERSQFGIPFNVRYAATPLDSVLVAACESRAGWNDTAVDARAGVCMEILHQLQARAYELALASMHTTGVPFDIAFRHDVSQGLANALALLARTYREIRPIFRGSNSAEISEASQRLTREVRMTGAGVGAVMGARVQPLREAVPVLLANLVCGNPVILKPEHDVILPLAIVVSVARQVIKASGADPNVVTLLLDDPWHKSACDLAARDAIRVIDFSGAPAVAAQIAERAGQAAIKVNSAGANPAILDSALDLGGVIRTVVHSHLRASGTLFECVRAIFVPSEGVRTDGGQATFEDVQALLVREMERCLADPSLAAGLLKSLPDGPGDHAEPPELSGWDSILSPSRVRHPDYARASLLFPGLVRSRWANVRPADIVQEGAPLLLIECDTPVDCIVAAAAMCRETGAHFAAIYSIDAGITRAACSALRDVAGTVHANLRLPLSPGDALCFSDGLARASLPRGAGAALGSEWVAGRYRVVATHMQV